MGRAFRGLALCVAAFSLAACATKLGPRTVRGARFDYNEAIVRSRNEQLLLNLVRLRYRDTPLFLDVGTVVTQYSYSGAAEVLPRLNADGGEGDELGLNVGVDYSETPTITYSPLQGEHFAQRMLSPLSPATMILLSKSGWSIERLLLCCVQYLNDLPNAPSAAGPTPSYVPDNSQFRRLAALLRELQAAGALNFRLIYDEAQKSVFVRMETPPPDHPLYSRAVEVRKLLGLRDDQQVFRLTSEALRRAPDEIAISGRSLLGVFFFLSHAVEAPRTHQERGLVTVTAGPENEVVDWSRLTGNLLRIRSAPGPPADAFVRVRYRGHWFYIPDSDLNSKATFSLITYLFSLQAVREEGPGPVLTVPVGK